MNLTPEIRNLLIFTFLAVLAVFALRGCESPAAVPFPRADLLGPIDSFTTRRVPARALLDRPQGGDRYGTRR